MLQFAEFTVTVHHFITFMRKSEVDLDFLFYVAGFVGCASLLLTETEKQRVTIELQLSKQGSG